RHANTLKVYQQTLALRQAKFGRDHPDTLLSMWGVADSLVRLDRGAEAVPVIDACVQRAADKAAHPSLLPCVLDLRLRHFEKAREAGVGGKPAAMWENLQRTDAGSLYQAARMRAVTAAVLRAAEPCPASAQQADAEADRALAWLRQAVTAGYSNTAHLKQDRDL